MSLCREVFPREHLSTERIVQHTVLLWRSSHLIPDIISWSERSLGTAPTQVRDDPSSRLTELEEDEEIKADTTIYIYIYIYKYNSDSVPGCILQIWAGRKEENIYFNH